MNVRLIKATRSDMETIWRMQIKAFSELLDKYQDYGVSPACESFKRMIENLFRFYNFLFDKDMHRLQSEKLKKFMVQSIGVLIRYYRKRVICICMKKWVIIRQAELKI